MLEFLHAEKKYDGRKIISISSLQLPKGIYWLQGQNGSGKTTLLRMTAGIIPFSGDVMVDGTSLKKDTTIYRSKISWADAEPEFPAFLSGEELISFYTYVRKASVLETKKIISILQAEHFIDQKIGTYSSGMTKKISILLAFMGRPSFILLDEPLSTLDSESAHLVMKMIHDFHGQFGTSFLLSSHHDMTKDFLVAPKKLLLIDQNIVL
ncbi:MAG TPA: ABC transporter ATP-binding protein [Puia sp.]|jgi:ABC-2 type transport system ATP-binding protein|nr:ABC transporter ATP-binding protein [Puia sp.]